MTYPQHEKVNALTSSLDLLKDFLSFLQDDLGYEIVKLDEHDRRGRQNVVETICHDHQRESLIFEFVGIDQKEFWAEKTRMIKEMRESHAPRS